MGRKRLYSDEERLDRKRWRQCLAARIKREAAYTRGPYKVEESIPPEVLVAQQLTLRWLRRAVERGRLNANALELGDPVGRRSASRIEIGALLG